MKLTWKISLFFQINLILGMADYALTLIPVDLFILLVGANIFLFAVM